MTKTPLVTKLETPEYYKKKLDRHTNKWIRSFYKEKLKEAESLLTPTL